MPVPQPDKYVEERERGSADLVHCLFIAIQHLQRARALNTEFAFGLDIPNERALVDVIHTRAEQHKKESTV